VEAGGQLLEAGHVVIATGSDPARPLVAGLDQVPVSTNRATRAAPPTATATS
jgi:pyruvate/2-oxoglutarate dehydrogenase complex dihydrolipoamide dehydrogenase (E3) component